jgi:hypothetical protein
MARFSCGHGSSMSICIKRIYATFRRSGQTRCGFLCGVADWSRKFTDALESNIPNLMHRKLASFDNAMLLMSAACFCLECRSNLLKPAATDQVKISTKTIISTMVPRPIYMSVSLMLLLRFAAGMALYPNIGIGIYENRGKKI